MIPRSPWIRLTGLSVTPGSAFTLMALLCLGCSRQADQFAPPPVAAGNTTALQNVIPAVSAEAESGQPVPLREPAGAPRPSGTLPQPERPGAASLPLYELTIEPNHLRNLERNAFANQTVPATFTFNGEVYPGVQVRYRGAWARTWPKKPLKIFFTKEKPFEGQRCLNLNSAWHDPALVRESLAYHVYQVCGVPASRSRMVQVHVNGRFRGVYAEVEQPDQAFLRQRQLKGAVVYKAISRAKQSDERDLGSADAYAQHYEKQTKKSEPGYEDLQVFCRQLSKTSDVLQFFNEHVDLEKYINYLAATALVQNWDGYNKNHFLVHDVEGTGKWLVVPWDLDRTFGDHWDWRFDESRLSPLMGVRQQPGVTGWNRLQDRFFSHPELRARFAGRLNELLQNEFTPEKLFPVLDGLAAEVGPHARQDRQRWPGQDPDLRGAIDQVKQFIRERRSYLLAEIAKLQKR